MRIVASISCLFAFVACLFAFVACGRPSVVVDTAHAATSSTSSTAASRTEADASAPHVSLAPVRIETVQRARSPSRSARSGEVIHVAGGRYHLGSTPGDVGRDPAVEVDGVDVDMQPFDIDALPYPNDPEQPIRTGATREEAAGLCRARGRRLCNEIEWERACRGPSETIYPGGDEWDSAKCGGRGDPGQCASGYGALVMGARSAEWTSDDLDQRGVIRGGAATAEAKVHRCASRRTATANTPGLEIAFRCCGGQAPNLAYPHEVSRPPFRESPMGAAQIRQIVNSVPELARLRAGLEIFSPPAISEVLHHGATTAEQHPEVSFTVSPVRWSPVFGEELLVFTAMSDVGSFVAAVWQLNTPDGTQPRYRHAASFILAGDKVSMALAYGRATREELQWSACWNCGGEHGVILYSKDDARVIAVQR